MRRALVGAVVLLAVLGGITWGLYGLAGPGAGSVFGRGTRERARVELPGGGAVLFLQYRRDPGPEQDEALLRRVDGADETRWEVPVFRIGPDELHVSDGRLIHTYVDEADGIATRAIDLETGAIQWRETALRSTAGWEFIGATFHHAFLPAASCLGEVLQTSPGTLRCVDEANGDERWRVSLPSVALNGRWPWDTARVKIADGAFLVTEPSHRELLRVDVETGDLAALVPEGSTGCLSGDALVLLDAEGRLTLQRDGEALGLGIEVGRGMVGECGRLDGRLAVAWAAPLDDEYERRGRDLDSPGPFPEPHTAAALEAPLERGGALLLFDEGTGALEVAHTSPWGLFRFPEPGAAPDGTVLLGQLPYLIHDEVGYADEEHRRFRVSDGALVRTP